MRSTCSHCAGLGQPLDRRYCHILCGFFHPKDGWCERAAQVHLVYTRHEFAVRSFRRCQRCGVYMLEFILLPPIRHEFVRLLIRIRAFDAFWVFRISQAFCGHPLSSAIQKIHWWGLWGFLTISRKAGILDWRFVFQNSCVGNKHNSMGIPCFAPSFKVVSQQRPKGFPPYVYFSSKVIVFWQRYDFQSDSTVVHSLRPKKIIKRAHVEGPFFGMVSLFCLDRLIVFQKTPHF